MFQLIIREWRLLFSKTYLLTLLVMLLALAWYLSASLQEYMAIATQLAQLNNKKGASELLLANGNNFLKWLILLWSVYFGARTLAQEKQWNTHRLYFAISATKLLFAKALVLITNFLLLTIPFWIFYFVLSAGVNWDDLLVNSLILGQFFWILYSASLVLLISSLQNQALSASLTSALVWLILWLIPTLVSNPEWLQNTLQYLSPFEHFSLLQKGILSLQTLIFFLLNLVLFNILTFHFWQKNT